MKNLINVLVSVLIFTGIIIGQTWEHEYDEIAESGYTVSEICEVEDGYIYANLGIGNKMNLFKAEKETGEIIWHKEHRITGYTSPTKILPMAGKKLLIIGCADYEYFLLVTDSLGNELKKKVWRPDGYYRSGLTKLVQNNDSTYTALGFLVIENDSSYFSLVKFDKNLEIIWEKSYLVLEGDIYAQNIIKDGENYMAFGILSGSLNALQAGLIKIDKDGNIIWQKKYPEYSFAGGLAELIKTSNGYLACSLSRHNGNAGPDYAALMKIDKDGNVVWFKDCILDFLEFGWMIKVWEINNEYIGVVKAQPYPYPETYVVRLDTFGTVIGYQKWNRMDASDAIFTQDQHLLIGGGNMYCNKPWAFKTSLPITDIVVPMVKVKEFKLRQNYPNPFNASTTISFDLPKNNHVKLIVYDIIGNEITALVNEKKQAGYHSVVWNPGDIASGMYVYRLIIGKNKVFTKKMVLIK